MAERPARLTLFGLFGAGNLGNDGTLEAAVGLARSSGIVEGLATSVEGAHDPAAFGVDLVWRLADPVGGRAGKARTLLRSIRALNAIARGSAAVVMTGTGPLERLPLGTWGMPFFLAVLATACQLHRTRFAMFGIGVEWNERRLVRAFIRRAMAASAYLSFRDEGSRDAAVRMGAAAASAPIHPDLAFALPRPVVPEPDAQLRPIALGVMDYHGTEDVVADGGVHGGYLGRLAELVRPLAAQGHRFAVVTGGRNDAETARAVASMINTDRPGTATAYDPVSLSELAGILARTEVVVATRFHNIVLGAMLGLPMVSISYAPKSDALMARVGLAAFCAGVGDFDPATVVQQVRRALRDRVTIRQQVRQAVAGWDGEVRSAWADLMDKLGQNHGERRW